MIGLQFPRKGRRQSTTVAIPPESSDPTGRVWERHTIYAEKCTSSHKAVDFGGSQQARQHNALC